MTTMAVDDPPLRRLFDRLDFAPRPSQARLAELLAQWEALRGERVAPRPPFAPGDAPADAFLFARRDGENDYVLERACSSLENVLGSAEAGDTLAAAPNPRQAARLRRLFDAVIKAGEPVLAEFAMEGAGDGAGRWICSRPRWPTPKAGFAESSAAANSDRNPAAPSAAPPRRASRPGRFSSPWRTRAPSPRASRLGSEPRSRRMKSAISKTASTRSGPRRACATATSTSSPT